MAQSRFNLGEFEVDPAANQLRRDQSVSEIEPRVMDLLVLFAQHPGEVLSKQTIAQALWGEVTVNDDALTRTLWKLRQALGDSAKAPRYIQTVPKRGYRLIQAVQSVSGETLSQPVRQTGLGRIPLELVGLGLVLVLAICVIALRPLFAPPEEPPEPSSQAMVLQRADAFYARYTRADNEAAQRLYEQILAESGDNAPALAGLSNTIAQDIIRFSGPEGGLAERTSLGEALASGWLDIEEARAALSRSEGLARRSIEVDPGHGRAWRALGLALSAQREFEAAESAYNRALVIEPDNWGAMINLSELASLNNNPERSLQYLEQAYSAMSRRFDEEALLIAPWQSEVGLNVATRRRALGDLAGAETWYRRILAVDPLNREAVSGLAGLLREGGDIAGSRALCDDLQRRTGEPCLISPVNERN